MTQSKLIQEFIKEFIQKQANNWIEDDLPLMKEKYTLALPKIIADLAESISQVCQQASQLQEDRHKGAAAYLCISFLHTNVFENKWEYRIDIYDEKQYFDQKECTTDWKLEFIWDYFEKHLTELHEAAHTKFYANKIRSYHLTEIKMRMAEQYNMATIAIVQLIIKQAIQTPAYQKLIKTPDFQISIGEYLDQGVVIHQESCIS